MVVFLIGQGDTDGLPSLLRGSSFSYEGRELRRRHGFKAQEFEHCRRDGTAFPMLMTGHVVRDEPGAPECFAVKPCPIPAATMNPYRKTRNVPSTCTQILRRRAKDDNMIRRAIIALCHFRSVI